MNRPQSKCVFLFISLTLLLPFLGCKKQGDSSSSEATASPIPTETANPTSTTNPAATSTPTFTPTPTLSACTGSLSGGSWRDPVNPPDSGHNGAFGGTAYAPNGDLYIFYQKGVYPNETLYADVRPNGSNVWALDGNGKAEKPLGFRNRTATVSFTGNTPTVMSESFGSVTIFDCTNCNNASMNWSTTAYYSANAGNPDGVYALNYGFLTRDGANLNLYFAYLHYNVVTGSENYGVQQIQQSASAWPADNTPGTDIDSTWPNYQFFPHGMSGAYQTGADVLVLSSVALRSTDHGSSFTEIMNSSGSPTNDLTGVSGSFQNPTDGTITLGNFYSSGGSHLAIWQTGDLGASFTKLTTVNVGSPYRARVVSVDNLIVVAYTIDGGSGESLVFVMRSYDCGATWNAPSPLIDATTILDPLHPHATYTVGDISLSANPNNGRVALQYSIMNGDTNLGAYLKEFY